MSNVVTRFAPSPTGFLHIGGARTALFNWLYARHHGGKFLLRIEDTDMKRSTQEAIEAIIDGLKWLNIDYDGEIIYQSQRIARHAEMANLLIETGKAYYCYCQEENKQPPAGKKERHKCTIPTGVNPVIRFKIEDTKEIVIKDMVYGQIKMDSSELDDMVILRSDKSSTYLFAVVIDDHDAGITHIIRGSDHLTNTFKQLLIYHALNFNLPSFAHIPLIHDENGQKLSKRHNATNIYQYEKMGILPQAMRNYLLRLGWSHGDDEIISDDQAIQWFNLDKIGRSPARVNLKKLKYLNNYYISNRSNQEILDMFTAKLELTDNKKYYLLHGLTELKKRAHYITELFDLAKFYTEDTPLYLSEEACQIIKSNLNTIDLLVKLLSRIETMAWTQNNLSTQIKEFAKLYGIKMENIYHSLRATITGIMNAPEIISIMIILGKDECIKRLQYANFM